MTRTRRAFAGAATSYLQFGLLIVLQFALAPLVLRHAGKDTLGAYAVIGQIVGYLGLLDLGFSVTFSRYLGHATGMQDDPGRFDRVMVTGKTFLLIVNVIIGCACFVLIGGVGPMLKLPPEVSREAQWSLVLIGLWTIARTPLVVKGTALIAQQDLAFRNLAGLFASVWRLVGSLVLVYAGFGLLGLTVASLSGEMLDSLACHIRFRKKWGNAGREWGIPDRSLFKEMLSFGSHALLINLGVRLVFFTDQIVVGVLYGAGATSVYYATQMPAMLGWTGIWRIADTATPAINQLMAMRAIDRLGEIFIRLHRYTLLLALPMAVGLSLLNKAFIACWVGVEQYAGHLMNVMLSIFVVMVSVSHLNAAFVMARGELRWVSRLSIIEGLLNRALSLLLGWKLGLAGVMTATVACHLVTGSYVQFAAQRDLRVGMMRFLREGVLPAVWPALISGGALAAMLHVLEVRSLTQFVAIGLAMVTLHGVAALLFSTDAQDRRWLAGLGRRFKQMLQPVKPN